MEKLIGLEEQLQLKSTGPAQNPSVEDQTISAISTPSQSEKRAMWVSEDT